MYILPAPSYGAGTNSGNLILPRKSMAMVSMGTEVFAFTAITHSTGERVADHVRQWNCGVEC